MELVVVERSYPESVALEDIAAQEKTVAWCLQEHAVTYKHSYFDVGRRHMVCLYEAPDAESVRKTQDTGGLSYDHIWTAAALDVPAPPEPPEGYTLVVVQREIPAEATGDILQGMLRTAHGTGCLDAHRVTLRASNFNPPAGRMVCAFHAPDADSVRKANAQGGLPMVRAWSAAYSES